MSWTKQNPNGGRFYEATEIKAINGIALPQVMASNATLNAKIPWGVDGYSRGFMNLQLGNPYSGSGSIQVFARPCGSDGQPIPNSLFFPVTAVIAVVGGTTIAALHLTWFDDKPGVNTYTPIGGASAVLIAANVANMTWATNVPMIEFQLVNTNVAANNLTGWDFFLCGDAR